MPVTQAQSMGSPLILAPNTSNGSLVVSVPSGTAAVALAISGNDVGSGDTVSNVLVEYTPIAGQPIDLINFAGTIAAPTTLYGVLPTGGLTGSIEMVGTTPAGNSLNVELLPLFLPPGVVTVSEVINAANNPVLVDAVPDPFQWSQTATFGASVTASVTFTPTFGVRGYVTYATADIVNTGAAAFAVDAKLVGATLGTVWQRKLYVPATGIDRIALDSTASYQFGIHEQITFELSATTAANTTTDLNLGGYLD